jgi:tetratricopeptide (TPR) repeat protein
MYVKTLIIFIFINILTLGISVNVVKTQTPQDDKSSILLRAYDLISTNPNEAIKLFELASQLDSSDSQIKKQLGYLYISEGQNEKAVENFKIADELSPSDTNKLQIAYLLNLLKRNEEALTYFQQLGNSIDSDIREKSQIAVLVLEQSTRGQKFPWWGDVYIAPYYDTRFESSFWYLRAHEGYYLDNNKFFSIYGAVKISGDSKSKKGTTLVAPELYSDNALILGAGLKISPFYGFSTEIQGGVGIELLESNSDRKVKEDFRVELIYENGIYPSISIPDKIQIALKPLADLFSSFGYYSRYKNGIGYGSCRLGVRIIEFKKRAIDIYSRFNIARDTEKKYYNNFIEWGGGVRIIPDHLFGLIFAAEFHRGRYWLVSDQPIPGNLYYNSYRFFIIFEKPI